MRNPEKMRLSNCVIFGGAGYIGTKLAEWLLKEKRYENIYLFDIRKSPLEGAAGITSIVGDVRKQIDIPGVEGTVDWIYNFAAIHREPGHEDQEYFETNILGAQNVCDFSDRVGCKRIFFTASISVYGPTLKPTDEDTLTTPNTPYGISKLTAEYIHSVWAQKEIDRRLIVVRPGVIYGPGDPGNILRMVKAVKKGYFFLPVDGNIRKSYGYIYGLLESMDFMITQPEKFITYNYVEKETETLYQMIAIIRETLGTKGVVIRIPFFMLYSAAWLIHIVKPNINGIHPARVKKVARKTHIVPKRLIEKNFKFRYDFRQSLVHWRQNSPGDF